MPTVLECTNLARAFGDVQAVSDVSFTVGAGETYGLLGPNGAGKTTSISMIAGLLAAHEGSVTLDGQLVTPDARAVKRAIGLVPQDLAVYPDLTARENLSFFGRLYDLRGNSLADRVSAVLEVVGLAERADDRVSTYSGGMKRRLNIAIGLLHRPRVLILDEPTVGVDPQSRNAILDAVDSLATDGMAVVYTTHYMEEAERLCDRIGIIDQGRIVAEGTRRELVVMIGEQDLVRLTVTGDVSAAVRACADLDGVASADADGEVVTCLVAEASHRLAPLLAAVAATHATVTGVEVREPDLEDVFLHLTGRALRDE